MPVQLRLGEAEVVRVPGQGVLLVQGQQAVLEDGLYCGLSGPYQQVLVVERRGLWRDIGCFATRSS